MISCDIHLAGAQAARALNHQSVAFCLSLASQGLEHGADGCDSVGFFRSQLSHSVKSRGAFGVGSCYSQHRNFVNQSRDFLSAYISGGETARLGFNAS